MKFWTTQLSAFGKINHIDYKSIPADIELGDSVEKMITNTRLQVKDMHKRNPNKPIILVGWDTAALVSLIVSILEPQCISAVCCLGFPLKSLLGYRGENIDPLIDVTCPVFIAVGSNATNCDINELEDFRDQLEVQTKLIQVEGGDTFLKVPNDIQLKNGMTQSMIDKRVIDEMWEFLYPITTGKYKNDIHVAALGQSEDRQTLESTPSHSRPITNSRPTPKAVRGTPKDQKQLKDYTAFLREKRKILGRNPNQDENKIFFKEFLALSKKGKSDRGNKRKKEDPNYEPSGKRVKTNEEFKQARNDETESAASFLACLNSSLVLTLLPLGS
jgi:hypothetical protein